MKIILGVLILLVVNPSFAKETMRVMDCAIYKMYDSGVFEESLSTTEYPSLDVSRTKSGQYSVSIGSSSFSYEDGDVITYSSNDSDAISVAFSAELNISTEYGVYRLKHQLKEEENSATLYKKYKDEKQFTKVAKFVCSYVESE